MNKLMIVSSLEKRGVKVNYFLLRVMIVKYVGQYRAMTREEAGSTGPWYHSFVIAMTLTLVCGIAGLVLR